MVEYATISEIGDKEHNEDSAKVFVNPQSLTYGFVLADGLGGHGNGNVAAEIVTDCFGAILENSDDIDKEFLDNCFFVSNRILNDEKEGRELPFIKTTLTVLVIRKNRASWAHIGDTRLYHFRDGKLLSKTFDHSVPQMLALNGEIKESEIRHHPDRNKLLSALGTDIDEPAYEADCVKIRIKKGDSFLLCSDGFWEWIEEKEMSKILKKDLSAFDALNEMTALVHANGEGNDMDNYSAILVNIK